MSKGPNKRAKDISNMLRSCKKSPDCYYERFNVVLETNINDFIGIKATDKNRILKECVKKILNFVGN